MINVDFKTYGVRVKVPVEVSRHPTSDNFKHGSVEGLFNRSFLETQVLHPLFGPRRRMFTDNSQGDK